MGITGKYPDKEEEEPGIKATPGSSFLPLPALLTKQVLFQLQKFFLGP